MELFFTSTNAIQWFTNTTAETSYVCLVGKKLKCPIILLSTASLDPLIFQCIVPHSPLPPPLCLLSILFTSKSLLCYPQTFLLPQGLPSYSLLANTSSLNLSGWPPPPNTLKKIPLSGVVAHNTSCPRPNSWFSSLLCQAAV